MANKNPWTPAVFQNSIVSNRNSNHLAIPVMEFPVDARIAVHMKGGGVFRITFIDPKKGTVLMSGGYFRKLRRLCFAGASEGENRIVAPLIISEKSMTFWGIHRKGRRTLTTLVSDFEWLPREWLLLRVFNRARFLPDDFSHLVSRTFKKAIGREYL